MALNPWANRVQRTDINVTALADVTLSLLLLFLVITPLVLYSFPTDLPQVGSGVGAAEEEQEVIVDVTDDNTIRIDGKVVDEAGLVDELRLLFPTGTTRERKVVFDGAPSASYVKVIAVMGLLRRENVEAIAVR